MKIALLSALMFFAQIGFAQEDLDAFKAYRVQEVVTEHVVSLEGQFDDQPIPATLQRLEMLANPVGIDGEAIKNRQQHLTWYRLQQASKEPLRVVEVENRFGQLRLTLGQPVFLLAPAEKKEAGSAAPTDLDHYKVYEVRQTKCVHRANRSVDLRDSLGEEKQVEVRFPRYLAVPVEKTVGGQRFPIHNAEEHLTIYEIRERKYSVGQWQVEDQFGTRDLTIENSELLCVPSRKREITPPQGLDHFQIYDVIDQPADHQLLLRGQFDRRSVETRLRRITQVATAVRKNDEPFVNEDAHFTVYQIVQQVADPIRMVQAWNQFGEQQLWIGAAHQLLVPAQRPAGNALAGEVDHYLCYPVVRRCSFSPTRVTLDDRWGEPREVSVTTPMWFCVPVTAGLGEIHNELNHLVIYRISPRHEPDQADVEVEDRFGVWDLTLRQSMMLAVPTLKFEFFPPLAPGAEATQ